jgi:hypothetical protein
MFGFVKQQVGLVSPSLDREESVEDDIGPYHQRRTGAHVLRPALLGIGC